MMERQTEESLTPLPPAAELDWTGLYEHFSAPTLELIGYEAAADLIATRENLVSQTAENDEFLDTIDPPSHKTETNMEAYFEANPDAATLCSTVLNLYRAKRTCDLYDVYAKHRNSFMPLPLRELEADLSHYETEIHNAVALRTLVGALTEQYDASDDEAEREDVMERTSQAFSGHNLIVDEDAAEAYSGKLRSLDSYLTTIRVFDKFEQLIKRIGIDPNAVPTYFEREVFDARYDIHATLFPPPKFTSFSVVRQYVDRLQALDRGKGVYDDVAELFYKHVEISEMRYDKQIAATVMQVGLKALKQAEKVLGLAVEVDAESIDFTKLPYALFDPRNDNVLAELTAFHYLTASRQLNAVRAEVGNCLTVVDAKRDYHPVLRKIWDKVALTAEWEQTLVDARQIMSGVIARKAEALTHEAKPVADLVAGNRVRPKKSAKKSVEVLPEVVAASVYDTLHQQRIFDDQEKALIAAIAAGSWEQVEKTKVRICEVAGFMLDVVSTHGCDPLPKHHPLLSILQFSSTDVLKRIHQRLVEHEDPLLAVLHADHAKKVEAAIVAVSE